MPRSAPETLARSLGSLFEGSSVAGLSDRQLLERYSAARDAAAEVAFAALVARHGPMVLNLCAQLLGDAHDAEDAFQAVFFVLARKARSIRDPGLLSSWLFGVTVRTARCAKLQLERRRKTVERHSMRGVTGGSSALLEAVAQPAEQPVLDREEAEALHTEIDRLPKAFRMAVILYYFEGLTIDEAARRLRCPSGTLRSRLFRARGKLKRALSRRGVVLSAAALGATMPSRPATAAPSQLCEKTARAAILCVAGQSASPAVAALVQEVLQSMLLHRLKLIALTLLLLGTVAASAGYLTGSVRAGDGPRISAPGLQTPVAAHSDDTVTKPAAGRMFVVGRVLDHQGKPVPGAKVMASAQARILPGAGVEGMNLAAIGHGGADQSGRFRLDAARTSSSRNDDVVVVALAPGYGVGWVKVDPDADTPEGDIALEPEQVIEGRLFDVYGRPAQGVVVSVYAVQRKLAYVLGFRARLRLTAEGPQYWWARINDLPGWPKPATTDANGRFAIHGVGRRLTARLSVIDPRFARDLFEVDTDDTPAAKSFSRALQPAKTITGRVTYADTGKPALHARLEIGASGEAQQGTRPTYFETDADGRFRANPSPGDRFFITAKIPLGQRYLSARKTLDWPKGAIEQSVDIALPRGVSLRGVVVDEGSARPVAGAFVNFRSHSRPGADSGGGLGESVTAADGTFELTVQPGAGHLAVQAPADDYVLRAITSGEFIGGQPGGRLLFSHGFVACDPKPSGPALEVRVALQRGVTVKGCILGPDGQPARGTWIISGVVFPPAPVAWRNWAFFYHAEAATGRFELRGFDPNSKESVYFLEPKRRLGATVRVSGKAATDERLTVRLDPCGSATARLVDAGGQPRGGYRNEALAAMLIAPGPELATRNRATRAGGSEQSIPVVVIDPTNYPEAPLSDAQGHVTFPALIPGARYRVTEPRASGPRKSKDFTVKPGETLDLGDILIEKP